MMCNTCTAVNLLYGTTEYVAPWHCKCILFTRAKREQVQSVLPGETQDSVRLRYWMARIKNGEL